MEDITKMIAAFASFDIAIGLILLAWVIRILLRVERLLSYQNSWIDRRTAEREATLGANIEEVLRNMPSSPFARHHRMQ